MDIAAETWLRIQSPPGLPAFNMGFDEALFEAVNSIGRPALRFYSWRQAAATFGYFQKFAEVAAATWLRPLIRRPTGGGLVPHAADWTYTLVFPADHCWHGWKAARIYQELHEWMAASFRTLGVPASLSSLENAGRLLECFARPVRSDLLWQNQKIAGAAQRRNRLGLLIQGSVQGTALPERKEWEAAFCLEATRRFGVVWAELADTTGLERSAAELAEKKYSQSWYNERR